MPGPIMRGSDDVVSSDMSDSAEQFADKSNHPTSADTQPGPQTNAPSDVPAGFPTGKGEAAALQRQMDYDVIEPVGWRVVIRRDEERRQTKSGIVLPERLADRGEEVAAAATGRVVAVSREVAGDEESTLRVYDRVLFDPSEAVPVELEHDNKLFVVSVDSVLAIYRRSRPERK